MIREVPSDSEINQYKSMVFDSYCINVNCKDWCLVDRYGCSGNQVGCPNFIKHVGPVIEWDKKASLKEKILKTKANIRKLEDDIKNKRKKLQELYAECNHDYEVVMKGYEEDIVICKLCGHEDSIRRTM